MNNPAMLSGSVLSKDKGPPLSGYRAWVNFVWGSVGLVIVLQALCQLLSEDCGAHVQPRGDDWSLAGLNVD